MTMEFDFPELMNILTGAAITAFVGYVAWRAQHARTARAMADALWAELHGVAFGNEDFAGFTSQVFDSQFEKLFTLPRELRVEVMGYHWRMKYLEGLLKAAGGIPANIIVRKGETTYEGGRWFAQETAKMEKRRNELLPPLRSMADDWLSAFIRVH